MSETIKFKEAMRGYDKAFVDAYVKKIQQGVVQLEEERNEAVDSAERLAANIAHLREEFEVLKRQKEEDEKNFRSKMQGDSSLEEELNRVRAEMQAAKEEEQDARRQLSRVMKQLESAKAERESNESFEFDELQTAYRELQAAHEKLQEENESNSKARILAEQERVRLEEENKKLVKEKETLSTQYKNLQRNVEDFNQQLKKVPQEEGSGDAAQLAGIFLSAKKEAEAYVREVKQKAAQTIAEADRKQQEIIKEADQRAQLIIEEAKQSKVEEVEDVKKELREQHEKTQKELEFTLMQAKDELEAAKKEAEMIRQQANVRIELADKREEQIVQRAKVRADKILGETNREFREMQEKLKDSVERFSQLYASIGDLTEDKEKAIGCIISEELDIRQQQSDNKQVQKTEDRDKKKDTNKAAVYRGNSKAGYRR